MTIPKPNKILVSLAQARDWSPDDFLIQEKVDGAFQVRNLEVGGDTHAIAGEFVAPKPGQFLTPRTRYMLSRFDGCFVPFDLMAINSEDGTTWNTGRRWGCLLALQPWFPPHWIIVQHRQEGFDGDFVDSLMSQGAEGLVAKRWDAPYGDMQCVKKLSTHRCIITSIVGSQSIGIAEIGVNGMIDRGRMKLPYDKLQKVRIGSILKIESLGEHESGKLREPRLCRDSETSWLVQR